MTDEGTRGHGDEGKGLKLSEIKKCAKCCKGVMHTGFPLFWRVTIERFGIDKAACDRRSGLETFFGGGLPGARLAGAMGPDEDLARPVMDELKLTLCEKCAMDSYPVAALAELEPESAATEKPEVDHARV